MRTLVLFCGFIFFFTINTIAQDIRESGGIYYANSKPYSGVYTSRFDNGNTRMTMNLEQGLKNGETRIYFESGKLNEICSYKNNLMDGTWVTYNESGMKVAVANYKDGKKHGEWKIWDDQGNLIYEMNYLNGEKTGKWKRYDASTGDLISERNF
jgi:antitoxin component YwqK of YwqJK toxin-antitoxin module